LLIIAAAWAQLGNLNKAERIENSAIRKKIRHLTKKNPKGALVLVVMVAVFSMNTTADVRLWRNGVAQQEYPYGDSLEARNRIMLAEWIRENTRDDAVIMDFEPWDLHFHAKRGTVAIPYDSLGRIAKVMDAYKVTHLTYYSPKYLAPLFNDELKKFSRIVYFPGANETYDESYPDLSGYTEKQAPDIAKPLVKNKKNKIEISDQLGYEHFIKDKDAEGRRSPEIKVEDMKDGLVLWAFTGGPAAVSAWPKTNDIQWSFDICR